MMVQQSVAGLTKLLGAKAREIYALCAPRFRPNRPRLTIDQVLAWADAHHTRTGRWPTVKSGVVAEDPSERWKAISEALNFGIRGFPGGASLPRLLAEARGVRNVRGLRPLGIRRILKWADAHYARHGTWPIVRSGVIPDSGGETWQRVQNGLISGERGLRRRTSLAQLLADKRGARNLRKPPDLTISQILKWADEYFAHTGRWPARQSGGIPKSPGESWRGIEHALIQGTRGLPGGLTLARLLELRQLGMEIQMSVPSGRLSVNGEGRRRRGRPRNKGRQ